VYEGISARIPLGRRGLTGGRNPMSVDAQSLLQAEGIKYDAEFLSKEDGATLWSPTPIAASSRINALFDWYATQTIQYLMAAGTDGTIWKFDVNTRVPTILVGGLATNRVTHIVPGGQETAVKPRKLFFFNGVNSVQVAEAPAGGVHALGTPAADWTGTNQPTFGVHHNARIFAGGNVNDPDRLYMCDRDNHEDFATVGKSASFAIYPGVGTRLVGGVSYAGRLFLFKEPRGVFWLDDSSLEIANWRIRKLSDGVGLASPWAIAPLEADVMFAAPNGLLYLLSSVEQGGGGSTDTTGGIVPVPVMEGDDLDVWVRNNLEPGQMPFCHLVYHSIRRTVFMTAGRINSAVNNAMIMLDYKRGGVKFSYSYRDRPQSLVLQRQPNGSQVLLSGDDAGQVWMHERSAKNKNLTQAYMGKFQTTHTDFSGVDIALADIRKRAKFLIIHFNPAGAHALAVDILIDGIYTQTVHFPLGSAGGLLNSFVLGTDRLGGDLALSRRRRIRGSGFRYSMIGYNGGLNEDFNVNEIVWQFTPSARRETARPTKR
jgi:hypothetical protein